MNVIVTKLEYAKEVWKGNAKSVDNVEAVQMAAAKSILGCSKTTSNTALGAESGMCPFETNRNMRR